MDINKDITYMITPKDGLLRVETHRSGIFKFQVGINTAALQPLLDRIEDAHRRLSSMPILPDVAAKLEREILVDSVYGTNTIESGGLTEEETAAVLDAPPEKAKEESALRVVNIRKAYDIAEEYGKYWRTQIKSEHYPHLILVEEMFVDLHKQITQDLRHADNIPGCYRDNPKDRRTQVGNAAHGGTYTPPKCLDDIQTLMSALVEWANTAPIYNLSPLLRAPLIHYYFERIHPFWDGNGRVGRVIEAMVLQAAGYKYIPFALPRYYLEHIDQYFSLFNQARKAEEKGGDYPSQEFVAFFLGGTLTVFNQLHDRINEILGHLLYKSRLRDLYELKAINNRQYHIVNNLLQVGATLTFTDMQSQLWYNSLYEKLTAKTRARDMKGLLEQQLIRYEDDGEGRKILLPIN